MKDWIIANWADIVDFFDQIWAFVKDIVLGKDEEADA